MDVEEVTRVSNFGKKSMIAIWAIVIGISVFALVISFKAMNRTKLDSESIRNINSIAERLERSAKSFEELTAENRESVAVQRAYLESNKANTDAKYQNLQKRYGTGDLTPDNFSNKWLFSQPDSQRGVKQTNGTISTIIN